MTASRRVGRPPRRVRVAGWWRRTCCGVRGHRWQEVRVITDDDLRHNLNDVIEQAPWIVRCLRPRCVAVRSWSGPCGQHHQAGRGEDA